ncbi:BON domain-containing protein [Polaromonas sp.]|jgi:osmotically-inducible protein OsmY|uniref:BON domain-containing protein n=1 Tax=Polaromonas sp. TaxID=1869339 RepID=UPI001D6B89DD|nr:BON domain-containing protein [Polaromonas sp.]MBT9475049.1 BON domain-containing protein [Polaromonas sp.]
MKHVAVKRLAWSLGATVLLSGALTACVPLMVGGAVAGGSMVATDRRTSGTQLEDEGIELRTRNRIRSAVGTRVRVSVTSYNRQVLLTGEVPSLQDKQLVEQVVAGGENVLSVVNELAVMNSPSLVEQSSDALVTGRVKAMLMDARDLHFNVFKVVTERGTTYLMGRVTTREADGATAVARAVPGVQKVVRIFEIISEDELARISPNGARPQAAPARAAGG